jgi:hypothetical protein
MTYDVLPPGVEPPLISLGCSLLGAVGVVVSRGRSAALGLAPWRTSSADHSEKILAAGTGDCASITASGCACDGLVTSSSPMTVQPETAMGKRRDSEWVMVPRE